MEIVNEKAALLSNYEVYAVLKELQASSEHKSNLKKHAPHHKKNLATIAYETTKYLEKTPCVHQDADCIERFLRAVDPFKLTKAEKLHLLNHRPSTAVEIQLLIEESEERLSEDEIDKLLDIVASVLPGAQQDVEPEQS